MNEQLGEFEALCRAAEGAVQLAGSGASLDASGALDAECELWEQRNGMAPGGLGADPARSIEGLRRILYAPATTARQAALASILLARLRRRIDADA